LLYLATFFEASCTFLYAFLELIQSKILFLLIVFFLRIIHGIGSAFVGTLIYSVACSSANEDELKSSLGYIELALSLGTSSGPLFASLFYNLG
jgi:MFS family permease